MTDVVIRYFLTKDSFAQMQDAAEVSTRGGVRYVVQNAVNKLWEAMPEKGEALHDFDGFPFPIDKQTAFPKDKLVRDRAEQQREVASDLWSTPEKAETQRRAVHAGQLEGKENLQQGARRRHQRERDQREQAKANKDA